MTFCQSKGDIPYFETSAKEAINVDQAFEGEYTHAPESDQRDFLLTNWMPQSLPATPSLKKSRKNSAATLTIPSTFTLKMTVMDVLVKRRLWWILFCFFFFVRFR